MAKQIGVQMIEMYCNMVKKNFAPILDELNLEEIALKKAIEIEVKKEIGVYDLYMEKAKMQLRYDEINRQLKRHEERYRNDAGDYATDIEREVNMRLLKQRSKFQSEVEKIKEDLIYKIKLSGVGIDIQDVFEKLPGIIANLSTQLQANQQLSSIPQKKQITNKKRGIK